MLQIPTKILLLVAAAVWLIAGTAVVSVGVDASEAGWTLQMFGSFAVVFAVFVIMFLMISRKHAKRILAYTDEMRFIGNFFDIPSYIIMVIMIGLGVTQRVSGLFPDSIIAFFYSGLGVALLVAAIYYLVTWVAVSDDLVVAKTK
jgi:hypothetical protein